MTEKTFMMYYPGKTPDGRGTYVEHKLEEAKTREEARVLAMGIVRVLEIQEMHIVENPNELVFYSWPMKPPGNG